MCNQMLAVAGKIQKFPVSVSLWRPGSQSMLTPSLVCGRIPLCPILRALSWPRILTSPHAVDLAGFGSGRLEKESITSVLSIISCFSGLGISPVPGAASPESWLTVGGSRGQPGCLSAVGKPCLPLPALSWWALGNSAPEYSTAGWIIKDLQLRSFHTVQSASCWAANLILKDTLHYSLWNSFVLKVLSFVCNSSTFRLFLPSLGLLSASLFSPCFSSPGQHFPSLWHGCGFTSLNPNFRCLP